MIFRRRVEYLVREGTEFELESPAFTHGGRIPARYTCEGEDVSPPLRWRGAPKEARSYALIVYDPDAPAGTFIHWVLYDVPASVTELPEAIPREEVIEGVGVQGRNDFGYVGYGGPCPPPGHGEHRYFFALHAVSAESLGLPPGATAQQVVERIRGRVVGYAVLMGTYSR